MARKKLAPIWHPVGILQRYRQYVQEPGDVTLSFQIGYFICIAPWKLKQNQLPYLLEQIRLSPRPTAVDLEKGIQRIARLRKPWLRRKKFRAYNTCYIRALTLYRFLDSGNHDMRIHFVAEPGSTDSDRLRGHAWITVAGEIVEESRKPYLQGRTREIYCHPPRK